MEKFEMSFFATRPLSSKKQYPLFESTNLSTNTSPFFNLMRHRLPLYVPLCVLMSGTSFVF